MTVDLRTGQTYAPQREDYCTKAAPCEPGGECPQWWEFLERVTDGNREYDFGRFSILVSDPPPWD